MSSINTGKVITAGLLAGLVFNIVDTVSNFTVLAPDMNAMVERLHLDPAIMTDFSKAIPWIAIDFILGILVVWTYASIRPRFGPGPKTALLAGLVPYLAVTVVLYGFTVMGVFTMAMYLKSSVFAAISLSLGSLAGGWAYKEA